MEEKNLSLMADPLLICILQGTQQPEKPGKPANKITPSVINKKKFISAIV